MFKYRNELKDSKVEYIGKIPKSWKIIRNKHIFNKTKVIAGPNWDKYNVLSLTKNGVIIKDIERNEGKMPSDFSIYQIVNPGNLLMCLFDIDVTPRCVGYIENKGIVSAAYTELSATDAIHIKYYFWWYLMLDIDKQLLHLSKNLRNSLSTEDFMALSVVKPPLEEQKQIAYYLDKKTAKIDANIAKNKELIELLEEKRVALINQKLNDIEFDSIKLKDVLKIGGYIRGPFGSSLKRDELKYDGIPVYEQQHAIHNSREFRYYIDEDKFKELIRFKTLPNDLIISCSGTIGKISIISEEDPIGIISQALLILRIDNNKILPKFLSYFLSSHKGHDYLVSESNGSAQVNISQKDVINKIPIKLPPLNIQKEIVFELENINSIINKTINKVQENINLLEEYKTSLIYHVVTGKIDVREEVI